MKHTQNPLHVEKDQLASERQANFSRRRFLRGLSACIALPAFESLIGGTAQAAVTGAGAPVAASATGAPVRMAFVYFPNGALPTAWWPKGSGKDFVLNKSMEPLANVKDQLQVIGGLQHLNATSGNDGGGDHARASGTFLTGVRVKKTSGSNIHAGVSIDQLVAQRVGHMTRFPSLELTCDAVRKSGGCDTGYSCAYQYNLSWSSPTTPVAPEPNPRLVFERLFGAGPQGKRRESYKLRQAQQKSVLDFVLDDTSSLQKQLGRRDQQKLDEYLTSVREIEKRIEQTEQFGKTPDPSIDTPPGIPRQFSDHIQIMFDMMLLAFQTDSTRIASFIMANEGSNRAFPEIGIPEGHHYLSHHRLKEDMMAKVAKIDLFYTKQLARFLEKMQETKDLDGKSLLDNSMIVYGCGNSDGNRHTHYNLPVILAGGGGGNLQPGKYVQFEPTPMTNLYLAMADRMGVKGVKSLGDSTGRVTGI